MIATLRLRNELRRWRLAGRRAILWWRDDDTRGPSAALDRLLACSDAGRTPLCLAVIPNAEARGLAALLAKRPWISVIQHGVDHKNRRDGPAAGEFPTSATEADIRRCLINGLSRLDNLPGWLAVFAPPWNDVHSRLPSALQACGYRGLSAEGRVEEPDGVRLDVHLDLLRWRGGARFRGRARLQAALARQLRVRRVGRLWSAPIGLLTHHLDHDQAAWQFLEAFLAWSQDHPVFVWRSLDELLTVGAPEERKPTNRIAAPAVCDTCGQPFRVGSAKLDGGRIIGVICRRCRERRIKEDAPNVTRKAPRPFDQLSRQARRAHDKRPQAITARARPITRDLANIQAAASSAAHAMPAKELITLSVQYITQNLAPAT